MVTRHIGTDFAARSGHRSARRRGESWALGRIFLAGRAVYWTTGRNGYGVLPLISGRAAGDTVAAGRVGGGRTGRVTGRNALDSVRGDIWIRWYAGGL